MCTAAAVVVFATYFSWYSFGGYDGRNFLDDFFYLDLDAGE